MKIDRETKVQQLEALTTENIELEEKIKTLSAALEEKESVVAALQGAREDIGETLMKIPVMEREISEMKVMLSQAQSQKERKEMQRSTILQDGEAMKEFAVQLQTMLGKNGMHDCLYTNCYHSVIPPSPLLTIQSHQRSLQNLETWRMSFSVPL